MKILLCVWRLTHGGAERVASMWAKGFVQEGHSVDFLLGSYSSPITYDIPEDCKIHYVCKLSDKISVRFIPYFIKKRTIRKVLKTSKPDLVVCVLPSWGGILRDAMDGMNRKIPIIITEHNSYERPDSAPMTKMQYEQKFKLNADYDIVTVLTQSDKNFLVKKMGEQFAQNTYVLPNPVSFEPVSEVPAKEKIVLAAGRLDAWHYKGFDLLLEAWARVAFKYPEWKLNIAGDGNPNYLKNIAKKHGVENQVNFLGFVNPLEEYRKSSIFVLSSRYEGFGMVLTEAMSQGCACIACDYKGRQKEIIENENQGLIVPAGDVDLLANAVEKMICDDAYRSCCQQNAIERAKDYSIKNITKKWNSIISKVV